MLSSVLQRLLPNGLRSHKVNIRRKYGYRNAAQNAGRSVSFGSLHAFILISFVAAACVQVSQGVLFGVESHSNVNVRCAATAITTLAYAAMIAFCRPSFQGSHRAATDQASGVLRGCTASPVSAPLPRPHQTQRKHSEDQYSQWQKRRDSQKASERQQRAFQEKGYLCAQSRFRPNYCLDPLLVRQSLLSTNASWATDQVIRSCL